MILAQASSRDNRPGVVRSPRQNTRFDWRAGKKSPGKVPGLGLGEERALGAETKKAANRRPPSLHPVVPLVANAARLVGREKPDAALVLRMSDVGVDCAAVPRRRRGGLHRSRGTRVDGTRSDVVGVNIAVSRALGSENRTDAKT